MNRQPALYRTPQKPGYPGGYDWRASFFGLLMLVVVNFVATQYVASRFQYQPALGRPLLRSQSGGIYEPFAWIVWGWHNSTSQDPRVRKPLFEGEMIVFAGSFVCVGLFFAAASRRSQKLMKNADDLHGSARWAAESDIRDTGLVDAKQGVYVGGWCAGNSNRLQYLRHNGPGTRSRLRADAQRQRRKPGDSDPPGLGGVGGHLRHQRRELGEDGGLSGESGSSLFQVLAGRAGLLVSFQSASGGSALHPARCIRRAEHRQHDRAHRRGFASGALLAGRRGVDHDRHDPARLLCRRGIQTSRLSERSGQRVHAAGSGFRETLDDLLNFVHDVEGKYHWQMPDGGSTRTHPTVREKVQEMLDKEDKDFGGVLSTAKTALTLYSDPLVARNTSASDFSIADLVSHERPVSLYLVVPPSDKIRLRPLIRLMFTMVVNRLTERMAFEGTDQKLNKHRLLLMIDEFPSLNRMEIFADALSYMAGYGMKAYLVTQDIRQIVDAYGTNESIVSNCHVRIAFAPNQFETAELLSR
jgi:type IV secretion system protein VirD4